MADKKPVESDTVKALRAQGLTEEQIKDWLDHNSISTPVRTK